MPPVEFVGRVGVTVLSDKGMRCTLWDHDLFKMRARLRHEGDGATAGAYGHTLTLDDVQALIDMIAKRNRGRRQPVQP